MGSFVEVKLYKPVDGNKVYTGNLSAYNDGDVEIEINGNTKSFEKAAVASVRLRIQ